MKNLTNTIDWAWMRFVLLVFPLWENLTTKKEKVNVFSYTEDRDNWGN